MGKGEIEHANAASAGWGVPITRAFNTERYTNVQMFATLMTGENRHLRVLVCVALITSETVFHV